jgi:O-antigen/teichoic acid export membrane protein
MITVRTQIPRGLVGNSIALLAATHITAVLGYVFWMLCARCFSAGVIGVTNTVISAMTLVAIVTVSGFVPMLTRRLPGASPEERGGLCSTAFVATTVVSGVAGVAAALLMPQRLQAEVGIGWLVALLGTGAVGTALLLVVNAALLGVRRAELSLLGGVVGSVSRLAAVAAALTLGVLAIGVDGSASHTILIIWVASLMISLVLSVWLLARATPGFRFRPGRIWASRMRRSVGWDHLATLAVRAPALAIPILAAAHFPPAQIGYLAVVVMILSAFLAVAASVSNSLLADCADDPGRLRAQARRASRLIALLLFVPVVITCLLAKEVLGIFGADYADYSPLLILLLLSTFPDAVINVAVAILRVQGQLAAVAAFTVAGATMSLVGAWLLMPHLGIFGAGLAVFASQSIVAIAFAALGPWLSQVKSCTASDKAPVSDAAAARTLTNDVRIGHQ